MKNRRIVIIGVIVLALLIGGYYGVRALTGANKSALTASGTIETTDISVGPEIGGKVAEVMVQEGDPVKAGTPLFKLDATLIQAQRNVAASALNTAKGSATTAEAALASAQAQYDIAQNTALGQVSLKQRTSDWSAATQSDFILPSWYYSQNEQISAAQAAVDAAQQTLADQQANLSKVQTVEGRSSTVYAIKLKVNDPQGRLKPGMPADVVFSTK